MGEIKLHDGVGGSGDVKGEDMVEHDIKEKHELVDKARGFICILLGGDHVNPHIMYRRK